MGVFPRASFLDYFFKLKRGASFQDDFLVDMGVFLRLTSFRGIINSGVDPGL